MDPSRAGRGFREGLTLRAKRDTVVITKHGKPVAKLVPADQSSDDIYNFLAGRGAITGDVVSPCNFREDWGELN